MNKGDTIKRKFKCKDGKIREVDCLIISAHPNKTRQMHPQTFKPIGDWKDCTSLVVRWVDINGAKRTDNITIY